MKNYLLVIVAGIFCSSIGFSQAGIVYKTFKSTRIINSHSTELLNKRSLDVRIGHRFGDFAGDNGGVKTFFGLDNSTDISVGFEYGVTSKFNIGVTRYKGAGPYRQLLEGYANYKVLSQSDKMPISLVALAKFNVTAMEASLDSTSPNSYSDFIDRISYSYQFLIARKFGERFSAQIIPTFLHRNYVGFYDENSTFSIGTGVKFQLTKLIGIIGEYHYVFLEKAVKQKMMLTNPIALGIEFDTGGHVFQLNFTNSRGFGEAQYIPSTTSNTLKGQFRIGFTIARVFKL